MITKKYKKYLLDDFKNLIIKSFKQNEEKIEFCSDNIKKWGLVSETKPTISKIIINETIDFDWINDRVDYILFSSEEAEDLFGEYQSLYEEILHELVLKKNVSMFSEYLHLVLNEFSKLPGDLGHTPHNTLDEAYILHSRIIVPKIINYYSKNIEDKKFASSLLQLAIHLAHYILLPFPDKYLTNLPVKRPISELESNRSLHDESWQEQSYEDYLDVYISLKNLEVMEEIIIMKSILSELNKIHRINSDSDNNGADITNKKLLNSLLLLNDENITLSIMDKDNHGDLILKSGDFKACLNLFSKMFLNNEDYCLNNLLAEIAELISTTNDRKELDYKLFAFTQELINLYIINKYKNIELLDKALKYASFISVNTIRCYCGKYSDNKYEGICCDRCNVVIEKGGLKNAAFDYIFKKLSGKDVYQWSHVMIKGGFTDFSLDNKSSTIFIQYINKIDDINNRRKLFLSLILFSQKQEYSIREKLIEKFRACQSDTLDEFINKSNLNYSDWAQDSLSVGEHYRKSYYESLKEEKIKSLYDESEWEEENFIENIIYSPDLWGGEPNSELVADDEDISHEKYLYDTYSESDYSRNYIRKLLNKNFEKLSVNGLKDNNFQYQIGEFYCNLIENYKETGNIKSMNICIEDFMESINKNGDLAIEKFIKLILDLNNYKEVIEALNNITKKNNYLLQRVVNYIIENTDINNLLLISRLNQSVSRENDFVILNGKFEKMDKSQIFIYIYQFSENINALKSFLTYTMNINQKQSNI